MKKTAEEILIDALSDHHVKLIKSEPTFKGWIVDAMKIYAQQVAEQALKDAVEEINDDDFISDSGYERNKDSILNTEIKLP